MLFSISSPSLASQLSRSQLDHPIIRRSPAEILHCFWELSTLGDQTRNGVLRVECLDTFSDLASQEAS